MNTPTSKTGATRAPRLVFVANVPWFFALHRLPTALMARDAGFDVHIVCGKGIGGEQITAHGLPLHRLPLPRDAFTPFGDARSIARLTALYRELRPDIVMHITLKPVLYGSIAARLANVPAVVNAFAGLGYAFIGGTRLARLRTRMILRALRSFLPRRHHVVTFENNDDRLLFVNSGVIGAEHTQVIAGGGVDTSRFPVTEEPAGPIVVLFASRMLKEKGAGYFVEAARRFKGSPLRFVMAGTPDTSNPGSLTEAQLRAWHDQGIIEWLGLRKDMPQVIAGSHIVCLPTYYREGVPRILMEAASCARPIITTDMPGCRDIVRHGETGLIVPPHDLDRLVDAIDRLVKSREERQAFGRRARELATSHFELALVKARHLDLWRKLLAETGGPGLPEAAF